MTHDELVALIRGGVLPEPGRVWADFGAGRGAFTRALRDLLPEGATVYAVDRDGAALRGQPPGVQARTGDFTRPLDLPPLDGLLVANALHFVARQQAAIARLAGYLKASGRFLVVEYDVSVPRGYIPYPLPPARFERLARLAGLRDPREVGRRVSPSSGTAMVALLATKP